MAFGIVQHPLAEIRMLHPLNLYIVKRLRRVFNPNVQTNLFVGRILLVLNGFNTVALTTGGCPMSVITPLKSERKIDSFFGFDHSEAINRSVVGLIVTSSISLRGAMRRTGCVG